MPLGHILVLMILQHNFHIGAVSPVFVSSNVIFGERLVGMGTDVVQHDQCSAVSFGYAREIVHCFIPNGHLCP